MFNESIFWWNETYLNEKVDWLPNNIIQQISMNVIQKTRKNYPLLMSKHIILQRDHWVDNSYSMRNPIGNNTTQNVTSDMRKPVELNLNQMKSTSSEHSLQLTNINQYFETFWWKYNVRLTSEHSNAV